jgi:hypothetical protein
MNTLMANLFIVFSSIQYALRLPTMRTGCLKKAIHHEPDSQDDSMIWINKNGFGWNDRFATATRGMCQVSANTLLAPLWRETRAVGGLKNP